MKRPSRDSTDKYISDTRDMDITAALRGWRFQSGQVNVRIIRGRNGKPKLQMRLDLGVLQMELDGRPDGKRPHRSKSELDYQLRRLNGHQATHGTDAAFTLSPRDCQALREESIMFYHRYLSFFVLEQYQAVVRDTQHNLDVMDLCRKYARNPADRTVLEQYRPYILMMHARARGCDALRQGYVQTALAYLRGGLKRIARLYRQTGQAGVFRRTHEARILLDMIKQIRIQLPPDPREALLRQLDKAVKAEHYEHAADLRDQLIAMQHGPLPEPQPPSMDAAGMKPAGKARTRGTSSRRRKPDGE